MYTKLRVNLKKLTCLKIRQQNIPANGGNRRVPVMFGEIDLSQITAGSCVSYAQMVAKVLWTDQELMNRYIQIEHRPSRQKQTTRLAWPANDQEVKRYLNS